MGCAPNLPVIRTVTVVVMLMTALMFAAALNFEPTRAGVAALILAGSSPLRRLSVFLSGIMVSGGVTGLLVLFVFHHAFDNLGSFGPGMVQIGTGVAALAIAALVAANVKLPQLSRAARPSERVPADGEPAEIAQVGLFTKLLKQSSKITDASPVWLFFVLGLACSLPSIDFVALLLLIAASGAPALAQIGVLLIFLTLGNLATVLPLLSHRVAPEATLRRVESFRTWLRSRSRRDFALILTLFGGVMIALGVVNL